MRSHALDLGDYEMQGDGSIILFDFVFMSMIIKAYSTPKL